ncbi:hypothetical protein OAG16_04095 [Saprospiraceae bacterium]|jgi:hypothetical protein|nr:hypothetical protein [Saprospiraceae bacterium]MDB4769238.1 hypothetical protein [Saprospiraceae bacterium]MDC3253271.1 hypothetical protein [bacterium]
MNKEQSLTLKMELVWWILTAVIAFAVLFPIMKSVDKYPFLFPNLVFIVVFITFTRYIFLLKHTILANRQLLKVIIFFLCLPLFTYLVNELTSVRTFLDERGIDSLVKNLNYDRHWSFANYVKTEMYFFGAASLVVTALLPLRLLLSVWRNRNRGTV